jgi:squalene-hopene/tetraprenyl-beta-curcumene cyclase
VVRRVVAVVLAGLIGASGSRLSEPRWNRAAADAYLERRADWWMRWQPAAREHGTVCVSCHTTLPYALARPADSPVARRLLDSVSTRVRQWKDIAPYYPDRRNGDSKSAESRGTESVLNALVLADAAARSPRSADCADTRAAFANMWAQQETRGPLAGAWRWLRFDLDPWEGRDSAYFGAALAALAIARVADDSRSTPQPQRQVEALRAFLNREYARQPLSNRAVLLWAAARFPGLIDPDRETALVDELVRAQRGDGGWSLAALDGASWSARLSRSDGYATGLATLALLGTGARDAARRGVSWLIRNQDSTTGSWPASSLNARRDPASDAALFMTDAATAFAVLAIREAGAIAGSLRQVRGGIARQEARIAIDHLDVDLSLALKDRIAEQADR